MKMMISLIAFILLCFLAAAVGSFFTQSSLKSWYLTIKKPSWNPSNKVFAPVWTILFLMMAIAAWMIWMRQPHGLFTQAMIFFLIQLLLNIGWSAVFFGLRRPGLAFLEIILLWIFIALTLSSFWNIYWLAGALLLPYLLWVSFAAVLNFCIWRLNQSQECFK